MKFYAVSDLHLDIHGIHRNYWHDFDQEATLIIAGDTANALAGISYVKNILCSHFKAVILVAGNHEWYSNKRKSHRFGKSSYLKESIGTTGLHNTKHSPLPKLKAHSDATENLFFLNNESLELDGCTIYGGCSGIVNLAT